MTIPHSWIGMEWNGSTSNNFNLLSRQRQLDKKGKKKKYKTLICMHMGDMLFDSFYL